MRSRNIKPGFFKNDHLLECDPIARILFSGLWCMADREGRLEDRPKKIKIEILPCDNCDVDILLQQLHDHNLIIRYEIAGEKYIQIPTFIEHQRPHSREQESAIPPYIEPKEMPKHDLGSGKPALIPDSPILIPESLPNGNSHAKKISLDCLSVDHNAEWLAKKRTEGRYLHHDEYFVLEQFKQYCHAKGKKYANYLDAYRNAFEWEKCLPKLGKPSKVDIAQSAVVDGLQQFRAGLSKQS